MASANEGRVYAQVIQGRCHWKFTKAELPQWQDSAFLVIDVTGKEPEIGDDYDEGTGLFTPAPVIPPIDLSDIANVDKFLRAACIYLGGLSGKTPQEVKQGIRTVFNSLS